MRRRAQAAGAGRIYGQSGASIVNVLVGAVKSIDGNHQWMSLAPPYPRTLPDPLAAEHSYGYTFDPTGVKTGMLLWNSDDASHNAFRHIFQGPLDAGLYTPDAFNPPFPDVLPASIDYHPTVTNAFPTWCPNHPERAMDCTGSFLPVTDRSGSVNISAPGIVNVTWSGDAPPAGYSANIINTATGAVVATIPDNRFRQDATTGFWSGRARLNRRVASGDYIVQFVSSTVDPVFGQPISDVFAIAGI